MTIAIWKRFFLHIFQSTYCFNTPPYRKFRRNKSTYPGIQKFDEFSHLELLMLAFFIITGRRWLDRTMLMKDVNIITIFEKYGATPAEIEEVLNKYYRNKWIHKKVKGHFNYYYANINQLTAQEIFKNKWHYARRLGVYRHLNLN